MEFALKLLLMYGISMGALLYAGFGITRLLTAPRIRGGELLLVPGIGLSLVLTVGYWCGWMGWSAGMAVVITAVLATVLNLLAVIQRRGAPLVIAQHLLPFAMALVLYSVAVYPIWRSGELAPIGLNGDQVGYTNITAYLEQNGLPPPPPSAQKPAVTQLSFINWGLPLGFNYFHAFVDKLLGTVPHETFSLITALCMALAILAYAFLARYLFGLHSQDTFIVTLLIAVNPLLTWVHYNNYGMHAMSLGLTPLAFGVAVIALEEGDRRSLILAAILLSAAFTSYPLLAVPFAIMPLGIYTLLLHLGKKQRLNVSAWRFSVLAVVGVLLTLPGTLHVGKFFPPMLGAIWGKGFGDVDAYVPWTAIYGLSYHILSEPGVRSTFAPGLTTFIAVAILLVTLYGIWRVQEDRRFLILALGFAYLPFMLWLRLGLNYPYGFFKASTFLAFPAIAGLAIGIERLGAAGWRPRIGIGFTWAFIALLLTVNLAHLIPLAKTVATTALDFHSLLELRNVEGLLREGETVHIRDAEGTSLLWMTYFLKPYNLTLAHYSPYYLWRDWPFYRKAIDADFVLVDNQAALSLAWAAEAVYENGHYTVLRKNPQVLVHADFAEQPYPLRQGQRMQIRLSSDQLVVNGEFFPLRMPLAGRHGFLQLGAFVPAGSTIQIDVSGRQQMISVAKDLPVLDWPITELPIEVTLIPVSNPGILISGWVEVVDGRGGREWGPVDTKVQDLFREAVLPGSGFFVAGGWYPLEEGMRRWTQAVAFATFRNPQRPAAFNLEGILPDYPEGESPATADILLNGHFLGQVEGRGTFRRTYPIPREQLGSSPWGLIEIQVNRIFNPKGFGLSRDSRGLGILMTRLELVELELPPDGFVDFGTRGARKYLAHGWANDEQLEGSTFVWAAEQESLLWVSFPEPRDFRVEMRLFPFRYPGAPPQTIAVYVNNRYLQDVPLDERYWQIHSFKLPQAVLSPGLNSIRFSYRYAIAPATIVPGNPDGRTLAVAFDFLMFRPE
jgi:hypothetical protein